MAQLTKGRLEAKEGSLAGDGNVEFMFNPTEFTISKTNAWNKRESAGSNVSQWNFGGGEPRQMTVELFFDCTLEDDKTKVRQTTNKLFNLMMIDESLQESQSKMGRPPKCSLVWGRDSRHHFECYIASCSVKYILFDGESGLPVRATANLTLKEERDPKALLPTHPTSLGDPGRRTWVVQEGDRLDWIAYKEYGDAKQWRLIAVANHLYNPLALRPGMVLTIPPRT
ncbi:MAG: CIS tube protein [Anaerolineae bacterium]